MNKKTALAIKKWEGISETEDGNISSQQEVTNEEYSAFRKLPVPVTYG